MRGTRLAVGLSAASVLLSALPGEAAPPEITIESAASGGAPARNVTPLGDLVSVYNFGPLRQSVIDAAITAAVDAGGWGVLGRGFGIGLVRVSRGGTLVRDAPGPYGEWYYPVSVTALPMDSIGAIMGRPVSSPISTGTVVMSETSAGLNGGVQAGDVLDLVAGNGSIVHLVVGRVAPDAEVGGAEIVMSTAQADGLQATLSTSVLIYGQFGRDSIDAALAARGLSGDPTVRIRRSWDPQDPDGTIGVARTKKLLGQFAYHVSPSGAVSVDETWRAAYVPGREPYPTGIFAACNVVIRADLTAALQEVVDTGLGGLIDVANANTYGGCYGPRFSRIVGSQLGSLSRHTWAQALDTNTTSNCQGCVPTMDCRIVRIFRKHNFAWGGNFINPDGMHFEWVGEPRNTYQYPSRYCPNLANGAIESYGGPPGGSRDSMFAADGWSLSGE